ncbi:cob(I)yrinic acid a,c-diamide adenosyltransferase [Mycoplasmoides alvi]|uniref:cob(I)yrinic acid a,c-diamide adenosyltransferase n=1 Tax=Mycoplasmoides alvi TaxID=78580 RepID=UPI00051BDE19|nr:cob(I)yrinic acid a,c-diamide adenosyltransferase [Mycoplasmoides alvi]
MIYSYYGFGQGKTSALNGLCLRAIASKKSILYIRFFKGIRSSEDKILEALGVKIHLFQTTNHFIWTKNDIEKNKIINEAQTALNFLKKEYKNFDYLFLDEIIDLVTNKILSSKDFCDFLKIISKDRYVFISGHYMDEEISKISSVLTHMEKKKHHYDLGISSKKFIDY